MVYTYSTSRMYSQDGTTWKHHSPGALLRSLIDGRCNYRNHESVQDRSVQRPHNIHEPESSAFLGNHRTPGLDHLLLAPGHYLQLLMSIECSCSPRWRCAISPSSPVSGGSSLDGIHSLYGNWLFEVPGSWVMIASSTYMSSSKKFRYGPSDAHPDDAFASAIPGLLV